MSDVSAVSSTPNHQVPTHRYQADEAAKELERKFDKGAGSLITKWGPTDAGRSSWTAPELRDGDTSLRLRWNANAGEGEMMIIIESMRSSSSTNDIYFVATRSFLNDNISVLQRVMREGTKVVPGIVKELKLDATRGRAPAKETLTPERWDKLLELVAAAFG